MMNGVKLKVHASTPARTWGLYAALFELELIAQVRIDGPSEHTAPHEAFPLGSKAVFQNEARFLGLPQIVTMTAEGIPVRLHDAADWAYPQKVAELLNWPADQLRIVSPRNE